MADSAISLLKNLFTIFFKKLAKPQQKEYDRNRFGSSQGEMAYKKALLEWSKYVKNSKSLVLSYAATVISLSDIIGQEGITAFNAWLALYAAPTSPDELSSTAVTDLKKWYDKYLKPLS